ncbi:hypothetical protein ACSBR1_001679 [Camellia fascicularis]
MVAVVAVLLDENGRLNDGSTKKISISSVVQGELYAIRMAFLLADTFNLSRVEDIRNMASVRGHKFNWTPRVANQVAHWTAMNYLRGSLGLDWVSMPSTTHLRFLSFVDAPSELL